MSRVLRLACKLRRLGSGFTWWARFKPPSNAETYSADSSTSTRSQHNRDIGTHKRARRRLELLAATDPESRRSHKTRVKQSKTVADFPLDIAGDVCKGVFRPDIQNFGSRVEEHGRQAGSPADQGCCAGSIASIGMPSGEDGRRSSRRCVGREQRLQIVACGRRGPGATSSGKYICTLAWRFTRMLRGSRGGLWPDRRLGQQEQQHIGVGPCAL
jgi:hypothetical protein